MRRVLLLALIVPSVCFGQTTNNNGATTNNTTTTELGVNSGANVNQPSVSINHNYRQSPGAIGPGMAVSAVETCLASISFGASTFLGGISIGIPLEDTSCSKRLNARMLSQLGQSTAGLVLLCQGSEDITRALAASGLFCPTVEESQKKLDDHRATIRNGELAKEINAQYRAEENERAAEAAKEQDVRSDSEKIEDLFYDSKGKAYRAKEFPDDKTAKATGAVKSDSGEWVIPVITERGGRF